MWDLLGDRPLETEVTVYRRFSFACSFAVPAPNGKCPHRMQKSLTFPTEKGNKFGQRYSLAYIQLRPSIKDAHLHSQSTGRSRTILATLHCKFQNPSVTDRCSQGSPPPPSLNQQFLSQFERQVYADVLFSFAKFRSLVTANLLTNSVLTGVA